MNAHMQYENAARCEPTPLMRPIPPGDPYPVDDLGPLRAAAEAFQDISQAPVEIAAQAALGVAALAAQGIADVETLHGCGPASLFLLTVAQSGERKSTCDRLAMKGVREFEAELSKIRRAEATQHKNKYEIWQARRADIIRKAKNDPDGSEADLRALGPEPEGPLAGSIVSAEPTVEGIVKNMHQLRPSLGVFSDEGGALIGGHGMSKENRLKTMAGFSSLWDGTPSSRWRAGDGISSALDGRRLSAHVMVQPVAATGLLADPVANGQGFLARFLLTEPSSAIGTRLRIGHSAASDDAVAAFSRNINAMLRRPLPLREGTRNELDLPMLVLDDEARELLQRFALNVEKRQASGSALEGARPSASKAAEQAARIAAVLTLYDDPDARVVTLAMMAHAVALAEYYVGEAARLSDAATIPLETAEAEMLRSWLIDTWPEEFISASDAAHSGPTRLRETAKLRKLLSMLQGYGWVVPVKGGAVIKGRKRREAWKIVREANA